MLRSLKQWIPIFALSIVLVATSAFANSGLEQARDLMEDNKFAEAREALEPLARSGNADAEELIGIMYALGLGVEKDDRRAFEWYLRSSMKGH
ncbi:MAG: sel1 repeat family protein, partial [Pseudomonadota bacterium]